MGSDIGHWAFLAQLRLALIYTLHRQLAQRWATRCAGLGSNCSVRGRRPPISTPSVFAADRPVLRYGQPCPQPSGPPGPESMQQPRISLPPWASPRSGDRSWNNTRTLRTRRAASPAALPWRTRERAGPVIQARGCTVVGRSNLRWRARNRRSEAGKWLVTRRAEPRFSALGFRDTGRAE